MAHDAFHARAHGTSAARLLSCLTALDGASTADLAEATGLHRTTVRRRLRALLDDLVEAVDDLYYLPRRLESGASLVGLGQVGVGGACPVGPVCR
ncbi:winged helix-turn-helix domain-containing protein [Streptomyces sp. NPDC003038]|uniref:winged helix-turn-helix domain-containing protein n=1 Tax=unclassified Streptomyces TaxID=2593676 RepID=UPI0033B038B8